MFLVGTSIRSSVEFRNFAGAFADPTTVKFKTRSPAGVETVLQHGVDGAVVKDAVGRYRCDFAASSPGNWHARWTGEGALVAAVEDVVPVDESEFDTP